MNIEELREYCLSLEGTTEKMPFGKFAKRYDSILVFYVMNHMFCFFDIDNFNWVNVKATPDTIESLALTHTSVSAPLNQSMKHWIQLEFNGDIPDREIRRLIADSYHLVKAKYTPKRKSNNNKV